MSLTKQERENLLKTIEIASGGTISTDEAHQKDIQMINLGRLIYIAEQCYEQGVSKGLLEQPLQYTLINVLESNADMLARSETIGVSEIRMVLSDMISAITSNYGYGDPFNPRFDSYIRLLLTMLVDIVELPITDAYEIIQSKWEKIFNGKEEVRLGVDVNLTLCTGYSRMMVVLSNYDTIRSNTIGEKDFSDIVDYLITIYKELHSDIIISQLSEVSTEDINWEDYKTYIKCIEGDNSPITRAYVEEIIDVLEKDHIVGMMSTSDKIDCLNNCIDNYYNIPFDGFDSDINTMTTY